MIYKPSSGTNRLNQCCTQLKSTGVEILCVLYLHDNVAFTSKWNGNSWNKTFYSQRVWIGGSGSCIPQIFSTGVAIFPCRLTAKQPNLRNTKQTHCKWTRDKLPFSFSFLFLSDSNVNCWQNIDMGHFEFQTQQNRQDTVEIKLNFLSDTEVWLFYLNIIRMVLERCPTATGCEHLQFDSRVSSNPTSLW